MNAMYMNAILSKATCLKNAGKETDTSLFSVERDDEYKPEFMNCFKEQMNDILGKQQAKYDELPVQQQAKTWNRRLEDDQLEPAIDKSYDLVMLNELYEADLNIFEKWKNKTIAKW